MYSISKDFTFSASHLLAGLSSDHPCSRLHGHNYIVRVELRSRSLNDSEFVRDYRELDRFKLHVIDGLDHRHLNDLLSFNPTAERIAKHLYEAFCTFHAISFRDAAGILRIGISETPKTWAFYEEETVV